MESTRPGESKYQSLGYKEELARTRGLYHILFMTISIMAVPFAISSPIVTCFIGGGPVTMIWGWIVVSVATFPLAFSLAEICAKYPTAAGAYYWTFRLASPKYRLFLSWVTGWLILTGLWIVSVSVTFGVARMIAAEVKVFHPTWVATDWETYLIFLLVTIIVTLPGVFFNKHLPLIDTISAYCTFFGVIVIAICLSIKASAGRRPATFAFGYFDASSSGWTPGWAFFTGLLPLAYTYCGIGAISSMTDEVRNPSVQVPAAMILSIPIGAICGLLFLLPILFTLPDVATLVAVPGGQPLGLMFGLIMGSKAGGFEMWFIVFLTAIFCSISICCTASRATWIFARDRAIPFSSTFSGVNSYLGGVPLNAYLLSTAIQLMVGLLSLGSTAALNAFVGVAVLCLNSGYVLPVTILLANGRNGVEGTTFYMGKIKGTVMNACAVIWVLFQIVLCSMPAVIPVTRVSMNYTSVVYVGFATISVVWYMIDGRFHYAGPPVPREMSEK